MRYLTAGESHGKAVCGILEGFPAGVKLDFGLVDEMLMRRNRAFGRGERAFNAVDKAEFVSGLHEGVTTGAPICVLISNGGSKGSEFDFFRPGHVDRAACDKYGYDEPWLGAERASARNTASVTALGAVAITLLRDMGIDLRAFVTEIGGIKTDGNITEEMERLVEEARNSGDTLGGKIRLVVSGLIAGIGSCDDRLDARLAGALMGIPAVKAVELGLGTDYAAMRGRDAADEITKDGRRSNNVGGIEGGISDGEDVVFRLTVKPVPSVTGVRTLDRFGNETVTGKVRGDVCVAHAACVVAEATAALALADMITKSFGGDNAAEIKARFEQKRSVCKK